MTPTPTHSIVTTLVADGDRLSTLPKVFGVSDMLRAEALVYGWMRRLCKEYNGGHWDFYLASNNAFFMAPSNAGKLRLSWQHVEGLFSPEAAGIAVCMFAWNQLCNATGRDQHIELYYALRELAIEHAESGLIMQLTD
jgi:hypothetical protein